MTSSGHNCLSYTALKYLYKDGLATYILSLANANLKSLRTHDLQENTLQVPVQGLVLRLILTLSSLVVLIILPCPDVIL